MIEIKGLGKTYAGNVVANDNICLSIPQGEFFCLLGPNGAGKSTLMRQISTELKPSCGSIHIKGVDAAKRPAKAKKQMGVMPQECGLFEHLSIDEHIKIFSRLKGLAKADLGRDSEILTSLNLAKYGDAKIGGLSYGMKKKVLLATALLGDPSVLLLDEPTTGLDPLSRVNVWNILLEKKRRGCSIFLTTHNFEEAEALSERFGIISSGRIIHIGAIESLRSRANLLFELKYEAAASGSATERFSDLFSAFIFIEKHNPKRFSLSTGSLENIYFDLVKT